jgi:hypothetical protein
MATSAEELPVSINYCDPAGVFSYKTGRINLQQSVNRIVDNILSHVDNGLRVLDYDVYLQTREQFKCHQLYGCDTPREMLNLTWDPQDFVMPYPECDGNTLRGLDALGVDRDLPQKDWSIDLYVLSRRVIPLGDLPRDTPTMKARLRFVSPTAWTAQDDVISVPQCMDYMMFSGYTSCKASSQHDPGWRTWAMMLENIGYMDMDSYLHLYLCPGMETLSCNVLAIAALLCPWPDRLSEILPEVQWHGVHRHARIDAWYTEELFKSGWSVIATPSFPVGVIPEIPDEEEGRVAIIAAAAKSTVREQLQSSSMRGNKTISMPGRPDRRDDHRWQGIDILTMTCDVTEAVTTARARSITAAVGGSDRTTDATT